MRSLQRGEISPSACRMKNSCPVLQALSSSKQEQPGTWITFLYPSWSHELSIKLYLGCKLCSLKESKTASEAEVAAQPKPVQELNLTHRKLESWLFLTCQWPALQWAIPQGGKLQCDLTVQLLLAAVVMLLQILLLIRKCFRPEQNFIKTPSQAQLSVPGHSPCSLPKVREWQVIV